MLHFDSNLFQEFDSERCDLPENLSDLKCNSIYLGKKSNLQYERNLDFRDVTDKDENAIQIRPQRVKLRLRPGFNIKIFSKDGRILSLLYCYYRRHTNN